MSRINGFFDSNAIHKVVNPGSIRPAAAESAQRTPAADRLELSGASQYLSVLKQQSGVRADLVASVRDQIDKGTYLTDAKLNVAVGRLLDDIDA
ncbi:MAG: flagellar biosynthesis anti-sigma factor FlgM [Tepidisphaeraceae bacterium]